MLLNNGRPKGISIRDKNALNIQANNLQNIQQQQQQPQQLPFGKSSKTPSPPQLKSLKQRSENDDLSQLLLANHQQQLKDLDQPLKPQLVLIDLPPASKPALRETKQAEPHNPIGLPQPAAVHRPQGLKRERPKSLIPRLASQLSEREAKREERIENIDDQSPARDDIFMVCDVAKDIFGYMFELEDSMALRKNFLRDQRVYLPKHRQRTVSWCIDIHSQLELLSETMYTTISILDRYFQNVIVNSQSEVMLAGVACTLIASKYEEIYPPEIEHLLHLTQNAYTKRDVLRKEIEILEKLKFDLGKPIPLAFLRRFSRAAHCDLKMHSIAKWLMETSLPYYECAHWKPSLLAATALFITIYLIHRDNTFGYWNKTLIHYTNYTRQQLMEPAATLCKIVKRVSANPKWSELKSIQVDQLIKIGEQYQQQ